MGAATLSAVELALKLLAEDSALESRVETGTTTLHDEYEPLGEVCSMFRKVCVCCGDDFSFAQGIPVMQRSRCNSFVKIAIVRRRATTNNNNNNSAAAAKIVATDDDDDDYNDDDEARNHD